MSFYLNLFIIWFIFHGLEMNVSYLERLKQFCFLVSLIMEVERWYLNKSTRRREPLEMFYIVLTTIDPADLWDPVDRSFEERSSATVDAIAPSNFPDFSCTNFRSENEARRRDEKEEHARRKEGIASPSTACSPIHACTYRPCMTKRLTGHADKNEKKFLLAF